MSKGSPVFSFRISADLLAAIDASRRRKNKHRFLVPLTVKDWIMEAIEEKLAHGLRAKRSRATRRNKSIPGIATSEVGIPGIDQLPDEGKEVTEL